MIKKMVSCIVALCIVGGLSIQTYAYDANSPQIPNTSNSSGIMPLFDNASYVGAGISVNAKNKAVCSGSCIQKRSL